MNIGKAAKLSNLTVKTVRYYADIGLVKPLKSKSTGYRDFSDDDLAQLQFVAKARKLNFNIQECEELLSLYSDKNSFSFARKLTSVSKFTYFSQPHSSGLSSLSISLPYDSNALSILSIKFGHPGFTLNSFPTSNNLSYKANPDSVFST